MFIKFIGTFQGGHTEVQFDSGKTVHNLGTFYLQIPIQIRLKPYKLFYIPDYFMREELELSANEDPVKWYAEHDAKAWKLENKTQQANEVNALFTKFMNAVGKFYNYDRAGAMKEHMELADSQQP